MQNQEPEQPSKNLSRAVILDLLPLYLAGEASPESSALVEKYIRNDPELQDQVDHNQLVELKKDPPSSGSPLS